jgi:SAM-dependent methyltransferase
MQLKYKRYYTYLIDNWNEKVANYIIETEIIGEAKYTITTTGIDDLKKLAKKGVDISHATLYMPAPYAMLDHFFNTINLKNFNHFVDIGCGKGRSLCMAAHYGVKKITGVEFSETLYQDAQANVAITKNLFPKAKFKLYHNDAFYFKIKKDMDCIFMFHPFDELIMSGVLENIEMSLEKNPRTMTIIYFNPVAKKLFLNYGYKEVYTYKKLHYLKGVVLQKN